MKAMLLKPIDGLEVGVTYVVDLDHNDENSTRIDATIWRNRSAKLFEHYYSFEQFLDDWFVFQEIPEQIKDQVEQAVTSAYFNSVIAGPKEYTESVVDVMSGLGMKEQQ